MKLKVVNEKIYTKKMEAGMNPITGTVVGDDGKEVAVTMVQMVEKFEKSCKVAPH